MVKEELILTTKRFHKYMDAKSKNLISTHSDLGQRNIELLILISEPSYEPVSQNKLCELYGVEKSNMVFILDSLEKKDLIHRVKNENNRRENLILPTPKGKKEAKRLFEIFEKEMESFLKKVSDDEIEIIINIMNKIMSDET